MRARGRRHWRATISISTGVMGTGPDAGSTVWTPDPERSNLQAAVQSMDRASVIRHGLTGDREYFWIRVSEEAGPLKPNTNAVGWNGQRLVITSVNHTPGTDYELIATAE